MRTKMNKINIVKDLRKIRDQISLEIMDLTLDQEKEYIKTQLKELKNKRLEKSYI
jgi:hypothetical protein